MEVSGNRFNCIPCLNHAKIVIIYFKVALLTTCSFPPSQINSIKDKVKSMAAFEREITRYTEEGKNDYKEVYIGSVLFLILS